MSEASRSRFTITLGRAGQVVKRAGSSLDNSMAGSKRSIRERLGDIVDPSPHFNNKRPRGDGRNTSAFDEEIHLKKDDLRYKIIQKKKLKQSQNSQQNGMDLRNLLSRPAQSSTNSIANRNKMPELKDTRSGSVDTMNARQNFTVPRDGRLLMPVARNSSQYIKEYRDVHVPVPSTSEIRESGQRFPQTDDVRHHLPDPNYYSIMTHVNSLRAADSLSRMEPKLDSYSPWNLESLRRRMPDETLPTSRGLSLRTRNEELHRRSAVRTYDDAKVSLYLNHDALENSRPMSSYCLTKTASVGMMKSMAPVASAPLPVPVSLSQKSSHMADDQLTVDSFLRSLGLERFSIVFKAEEVDMYSLRRMVDSDLKEIGLPMMMFLNKFQNVQMMTYVDLISPLPKWNSAIKGA